MSKDYKLARSDEEVRVSFGSEQAFAAWSSASTGPALDAVADEPRDATAVPAAVSAPAREPEVHVLQARNGRGPLFHSEQPRITVTWDRASIADVVAGFAAFSGRTIILGKDIKGEVSAEIKNQPWDQAFQAILATQGLSATEMPGGIIRVDAPAALAALDSLEPLESRQVPINYTPLAQITKSVETLLTKGRGRVIADSASSSLIVTDTRSRVDDVTRFVTNLDRKTPQILIKAKIVFVDRTDLERLGLRYDLGSANQAYQTVITRPSTPGVDSVPRPRVRTRRVRGPRREHPVADRQRQRPGAGRGPEPGLLDHSRRQHAHLVPERPAAAAAGRYPGGADHHARWTTAKPTSWSVKRRRCRVRRPLRAPPWRVQQAQFKETGIRLTVTPHVTNSGQILMCARAPSGPRSQSLPAVAVRLHLQRSRRPRTSCW